MAGDGEFDFIRQRLLPLTQGDPAARRLCDDAALLTPPAGDELVLACDTLVRGVHFRDADTPEVAASRVLRTNLSDLAAMGAEPRHYLMALSWPRDLDTNWRDRFIAALHAEQGRFGLTLIGGDTTSTPGPLTVSLTLIGAVPAGCALSREDAAPGEEVWVSGVIGDGYLGLQAARAGEADLMPCLLRYEVPEPRLALGRALRGVASSTLDVSDGLVADLGHLADASGCRIEIEAERVPVSKAAAAWIARGNDRIALLTGGDDYELTFTAPTERRADLSSIARSTGVPLTRIGQVVAGEGVSVRDGKGEPIPLSSAGFTHF